MKINVFLKYEVNKFFLSVYKGVGIRFKVRFLWFLPDPGVFGVRSMGICFFFLLVWVRLLVTLMKCIKG